MLNDTELDKLFKPDRRVGGSISKRELGKRLAHYMQIPKKYAMRLVGALDKVILDAILHGEEIEFPTVGKIGLMQHRSETVTAFGVKGIKRSRMYKFTLTPTSESDRFIVDMTREYFKRVDDDSVRED